MPLPSLLLAPSTLLLPTPTLVPSAPLSILLVDCTLRTVFLPTGKRALPRLEDQS